jgi:Delta3-Delta2-enoyl-CoA isomerase
VIETARHDNVCVITMTDGENRFNRESISRWHAALDDVEAVDGPLALVTTGTGKFYSNGLDLDWLVAAGDDARGFIDDVHRLLGRMLGFPAFTVAAVNGHAFAAGAMLASAHDAIVMRDDRGYWCLPEVDLGLPLSPAMLAVVAAHVPEPALRDAALTGRRFDAADARTAGIVAETATEATVLERAIARAEAVATKNRDVIREHKRLLYADALRLCGVGD